MKKMFTVLAATLFCGALLFASCGKDDDSNNGSGDPETLQWVDLGLPSGLQWADRNVGASKPEDYGSYFAWAETETKESYKWDTYRYCTYKDGIAGPVYDSITKYNTIAGYGPVDNKTVLEEMDDAATANIGGDAYTPTIEDWKELINNTTHEYTTKNGVNGLKLTGPNGNSIFLPAAGTKNLPSGIGAKGYYWSAELNPEYPTEGKFFFFSASKVDTGAKVRIDGLPVRAVRAGK